MPRFTLAAVLLFAACGAPQAPAAEPPEEAPIGTVSPDGSLGHQNSRGAIGADCSAVTPCLTYLDCVEGVCAEHGGSKPPDAGTVPFPDSGPHDAGGHNHPDAGVDYVLDAGAVDAGRPYSGPCQLDSDCNEPLQTCGSAAHLCAFAVGVCVVDTDCPAGASCHDNVCQCQYGTICPSASLCVWPQSDTNNCGWCGNKCGAHQTCEAGQCR